jgi:tetratricopeptide (TPR) repeat protein
MAKVSLRMYNREIEGLIEHGQRLDEAIAHCRHILKTFPKYLETYRLLGKANLEAKHYSEAVDVFQRVLVVAPDDFVSHVGMSIIADDQNKLDDAIWHMERAFEVQPSNAAIQGELQRLFARRDGVEPPKIRLTRGALAHMYVQGELYNQAISEIRAVLSNDAKRTDMQVLLANAYFHNGQKAEATEICTELLTKYPYCLDANRLMVEILPGTQRADSVTEYRNRVNELDPYAAYTQDSLFHTESVPDSTVSLERLEYTGQAIDDKEVMGIGLESDSTAIGRNLDQPKWLKSASTADTGSPLTGAAPSAPESKPASSPSGSDEDIPEFLRQAGWTNSSGEFQEGTSFVGEDGSSEPPAIQGDLPDWVKALAPAEEDEPASVSSQASEESPIYSADTPDWLKNLGGDQPATSNTAPETSKEETPDWIKNLDGRELDEPAPASKPASEPDADWLKSLEAEPSTAPSQPLGDESPDWLKEFDNDLETPIPKIDQPTEPAASEPKSFSIHLEPEEPPAKAPEPSANLGSLGTSAQEQDDAMAWLESLAAKHGAKPEELVTDPNARTDTAPDWVDKAKEINEQAPASEDRPVSGSDDSTGVWLRNLEEEETESQIPGHAEPELADWMSGLIDQDNLGETPADIDKGELPIMDDSGTPDWLSDLGPKPVERTTMEDVPDWLHPSSTGPKHPEPLTPQSSFAGSDSGVDLPDWLASLDNEPMASAPETSSGDVPAWLQSEVEPEPQATEPAHPADWQPIETEKPTEKPPVSEKPPVMEEKAIPEVSSGISQEPAPAPEPKVAAEAAPRVPTRTPEKPAPVPEPVAAVEQPRPAPAQVARPKPAVKTKVVINGGSLVNAKSELGRGNIAAALDVYGKLIRKGKALEDIIRDLRDALYRYPVEVPIWQTLGDAYMRANRLQEALDAYTKAEELLR